MRRESEGWERGKGGRRGNKKDGVVNAIQLLKK